MFGKKLSEYIRFERWILIALILVFVARLALSLSGTSREQTMWVSMNLVLLVGMFYCAVAVPVRMFGGYKHLLALLLIQEFVSHILIASAILLAIMTGQDNIFTAPEYSGGGDGKTAFHVTAHFLLWPLIALVTWVFSLPVMFVVKKLRSQS